MAKVVNDKPAKIIAGKWGTENVLPDSVKEAFETEYPQWDWLHISEGNDSWIIARLYDNGKEFERVACKIIARKTIE